MASEQFRRQLKQEAARWQQDAWISPEQHARLTEHYSLERLERASYGQFIILLISIGCLLVGIGCITFVAANWQLIPRLLKVVLLVSVFLAVSITGFVLHRRSAGGRQRLGHGLLLLGALAFGGNLALMGQIFHQSGSGYGLCAAWSLGVLGMAYGLRLASLGVMAQLLAGTSYVLWLRDGSWFAVDTASALDVLLQQMPLVALILFLPLAYRSHSRSIFLLTAVGTAFSLVISLGWLSGTGSLGSWIALMLVLPVSLLWGYDDRSWLNRNAGAEAAIGLSFRPLSRAIAVAYLGGALYLASFYGVWSSIDAGRRIEMEATARSSVSVIALSGAAVLVWLYAAWPRRDRRWRLGSTDGVVLGLLGLMTGVCIVHWHVAPLPAAATFIANVVLAVLGIGTMREGLDESDRAQFWWGLALLVLQILSRVLEYNTGLLVKSFTFLLCGVAVIALGLWFERYIRPSSHSPL